MALLWLEALGFGLFSALSLPIGAWLGIMLHPVSEKTAARWMAFGAGALVFAVATQLYGEALFELMLAASLSKIKGEDCNHVCHTRYRNVMLQNLTGVCGAVLFWAMSRMVARLSARWADGDAAVAAPAAEAAVSAQASQGSYRRGATLPPSMTGQQLLEHQPTVTRRASIGAICDSDRRPSLPAACLYAYRTSTGMTRTATATAAANAVAAEREASSLGGSASADSLGVNGEQSREVGHGHGEANVALSMWLGLMLDGIPESLMLGFMTNEKKITWEFLIAIFIANFPEAFAGTSHLLAQKMPKKKIYAMWGSVFLVTGLLSMVGSLILPDQVQHDSIEEGVRDTSTALLEGLTGGAMLAMISTAMLPAALEGAGEHSGILFVFGFVLSVFINALGARYGGPQDLHNV